MTDQARAQKLLARRAHPPTTFGSIFAQAHIRIPIAIAVGLVVWAGIALHMEPIATLLVGLWAGSLLRDIRYASAIAQVWPFTERVFDWEKILKIAEGKD